MKNWVFENLVTHYFVQSVVGFWSSVLVFLRANSKSYFKLRRVTAQCQITLV